MQCNVPPPDFVVVAPDLPEEQGRKNEQQRDYLEFRRYLYGEPDLEYCDQENQ